jgi:hypothetical protein
VRVAPSTQRGNPHVPQERSNLPDLALYVRLGGQVVEVGQASNTLALSSEYPVRLKRGDTVEVRLVDRNATSLRVVYDSRLKDDWSTAHTHEVPLAQFSFVFEGPGRYFFHQGYGLFFVDLRKLT